MSRVDPARGMHEKAERVAPGRGAHEACGHRSERACRRRRVAYGPCAPRVGGRALLFVAAALAAAVALLLTRFALQRWETSPAIGPTDGPAPAELVTSQLAGLAAPDDAQPGPDAERERAAGTDAGGRLRRFEGTGSIRGRLVVPPGGRLPETWTVRVGPSLYLEGRQHAVRRDVTCGGDTSEFEIGDLPLAGYDVRVEAAGMNSNPQPVLLVRGAEHPYVTVSIYATGFIDGFVIEEGGRVAEGLQVTLERSATGERRTVATGATGAYLFADVPDGQYRLLFGPPDRPLIPAGELSFRAPSMNYPRREIPPTATAQIRTVDRTGARVPRARVEGFGPEGGSIQVTTDELGLAEVRYLPPGTYQLSARDDSGRRGKMAAELELGEPADVFIPLSD